MTQEQKDHLFTNGRIVLADRVIDRGWVAIVDDRIVEIGEGQPPERGENCEGDLLMPGLVELHTDHLEAHFMPRPKVYWNPVAAVVSYDGQMATSGITTVLDSLRVWSDEPDAVDSETELLANAIADARAANLLRADHYLHLRCEVPTPDVVELAGRLMGRQDVRLTSLMDHTPGQRQFRDPEKLRTYYRGKSGGLTDVELDALFEKRIRLQRAHGEDNYRRLVGLAKQFHKPLASHDDTTLDHVSQAIDDGIAIAEFPTTTEAAAGLHDAGIKVMMGAPNLVRGGSHSGNIATADLAREGMLDILSSDYIPSSLLMAAMQMPSAVPGIDLAAAVRTITKTPAEAVGFTDRGEIAKSKRADLIRVHLAGDVPAVRSVWLAGTRVA
ncbi:MAG TPA: alpha-D-ribose 1-methylphosphonate 5-triphosphate diphosphatase [Pseudorhodoplanes sp.]|nr:alpha-D-ribose 1-methylphosphonate 5-triphosphate diphosphatase [Pseudorhodoplanes sp.]